MTLSVLCVTFAPPRARPFLEDLERLAARLGAELVIAADGPDAVEAVPVACRIVPVQSKGYMESVLDEAVAACQGDYILRVDDDEKCSAAMVAWLGSRVYRNGLNWSFPRVHLWGDPQTAVLNKYYFPDFQTRLSVKAQAGGRPAMHQASPFPSKFAPVCLEHWCYLVKSYEERIAIAENYQRVMHGGDGGRFRASAIEDENPDGVTLADYTTGGFPWRPVNVRQSLLRRTE